MCRDRWRMDEVWWMSVLDDDQCSLLVEWSSSYMRIFLALLVWYQNISSKHPKVECSDREESN